ncbi:hypothetical protein RND81_04G086500 [Saponaria officinalis]|uniref:Aminotransferase-like plant mobile domain-containing protein n=1 Tax=Saponaria officinalis TaxID=3572 RepID=A0AAW1LJD6_SAPOF
MLQQIQVTQPSCSNPRVDIQIPKAPSTPIKTSNTFTPLSQTNFPALPYSEVLKNQPTTQKEKETLIQSTPTVQGYLTKNAIEPLILTKYLTSPPLLEFRVNNSKIFAQGIHWFSDIIKNQRFYEFILVDSGSADIKHDRDTSGNISYSKIIINKVISSDNWIEPFAEKDFSKRFIPQTHSYQDYINAWSRALLLRDFDHSWFVSFHKNCPQRFPIRFYQWWHHFGPAPDIYPPICRKGLETFSTLTKGNSFQKPLLFHAEQILPEPFPLSLIREFKVKWWSKFDPSFCSPEAVQSFIQTGIKLERAVKDFNQPYAQASSSSSKTRPPKHSKSSTVKQSSEERKSAMKQTVKDPIFRNELLQVIRKQISEEEDDESSASLSSNSGSIHIYDDHVFGGPCSQDPFDN